MNSRTNGRRLSDCGCHMPTEPLASHSEVDERGGLAAFVDVTIEHEI